MEPVTKASARKAAWWIVVVVAAGVAIYVFKFRPIPVAIAPAAVGTVVAEVMGTGTLEARFKATVSAKIQGRIAELLVDQNQPVKKGQLLARLDDAELRQEVGIAQATLDAALATVERVKAEEGRTKVVLEQAGRDYQRHVLLAESKAISVESIEKTKEKLEVAKADVDRAAASVTEADRQVVTAREKLGYAQARLADTHIVTPFHGLIVRRDRELGDIVVPGGSIYQLVSLDQLWVSAWVDESAMADLAPEQPARIVFRSETAKQHAGTVFRLGREVDRESREFLVDVLVKELPDNWAVGQRAEVYIETGKKPDVLKVPLRLVQWRSGKSGVFVDDGGTAVWRDVSLGLRGRDAVEVRTGLSKGEFLVDVSGLPAGTAIDGRRVRPQ